MALLVTTRRGVVTSETRQWQQRLRGLLVKVGISPFMLVLLLSSLSLVFIYDMDDAFIRNLLLVSSINFVEPTKMFSATSKAVLVNDRKEYVLKRDNNRYKKYDVLEREVCIYNHLAPFSWAPKVVWSNSSTLITSYVGEPLTVFNIPLDYREEYEKILVDMESVGVEHGDIYKECHGEDPRKCKVDNEKKMVEGGLLKEDYELMLNHVDGKSYMSLVDFGWATIHGSWACDSKTMRNEATGGYHPHKDRSVRKMLDSTFRRHLQVEQHFLVDWTLHYTEKHVRNVIKSWPNLLVRKMVQHPKITDDEERISTLSTFYNTHIDDFRGTTPFNMYFIYDLKPTYDLRPSSKGQRLVNIAMFDLKKALRTSMGGGFKIHATDNIQETKENQVALRQPEEYQKREFDSLRRVFDVLNFWGIDYVVLRNFEKMPDEVKVDPNHLDVDLLVSDYYEAKRLLDGENPPSKWSTSYENGYYRVVNKVIIDGKQVDFDVRHVGDDYLDKQWQLDILKHRVKLDSGIYVPSEEDHLHSIIYHAIIQKPSISQTYVNVMTSLGKFTDAQARDKKFLREKLDSFMESHGYKMVPPLDKSVGYFSF